MRLKGMPDAPDECAAAGSERLLAAVADVAELVIGRNINRDSFQKVLSILGTSVPASRVWIAEIRADSHGRARSVPLHEWRARIEKADAALSAAGLADVPRRWIDLLASGASLCSGQQEFPPGELALLNVSHVRAMAIVPVLRQPGLWGFVAFEDHVSPRQWSEPTLDCLRRVGRLLAASLDRCDRCQRQVTLEAGFHSLLDGLNDVVFKTDDRGRLTYLNGAWANLRGTPPRDAMGQFCGQFVVAEDRSKFRRELVRMLRGELRSYRCELRVQRIDGSPRWVQVSAGPLDLPGRVNGGLVGTIVDVSASKQAEEELRQAKAEAEAANRAKSEFLSTMSHELRTPLNAVIGLSESLLEANAERDEVRTRRFLELIHSAGNQLFRHINDILDLARIESGRMEVNASLLDVRLLCATAYDAVRTEAAAKSIRLDLDQTPEALVIEADERLVAKAVHNLLMNAIKFTDAGGRVAISAHRDGTGIAIAVADTGIGIPEDKLNLLFKPFRQVDSSLARRFGGAGLGLVLVDKYIRLHGGSVTVSSRPVIGSTFTIHLPAQVRSQTRSTT